MVGELGGGVMGFVKPVGGGVVLLAGVRVVKINVVGGWESSYRDTCNSMSLCF